MCANVNKDARRRRDEIPQVRIGVFYLYTCRASECNVSDVSRGWETCGKRGSVKMRAGLHARVTARCALINYGRARGEIRREESRVR